MHFEPTPIPDVLLIYPRVFEDQRGSFMEVWRASRFAEAGLDLHFVQENQSRSGQNVLRGLHYQLQQPQGKLIRVVLGEVFDVAVDLRRSSATFGRWCGHRLSARNKIQLWVPPGFAHGFYVLSSEVEIIYKCTAYYAPGDEHCIRWDDPDLGIEWPLLPGSYPRLSAKDEEGRWFKEAEYYK